ncbi:MAG: tail fiber protein [Actinobacteria bacterium]|nr:tail fiber protein [Actinomycetota bacterium]
MNSRLRAVRAPRSLLASFAILVSLALPALASAKGPAGLPANTSLLFSLNAKGGRLEPVGTPRRGLYTLTLRGVDKEVTWFADRPHRDAGLLAAPRLFGDWGRLGFRKSPPNAALVVSGARAGEDTMALALRLRHYDGRDHTATFSARALGSVGGGLRDLEHRLDRTVPARFHAASLFIDNGEFYFGCTEGRPELMAVEAGSLREHFQEAEGYLPAEGQAVPINNFEALYALIGDLFEPEEELIPSTTNFHLPALKGPAGTSWYMCSNGWFPEEGELGEGLIGEVAYFPPWIAANRADGTWLPADGRTVQASEIPVYAAEYGEGAASIALPNVPSLDGMTPMVDVASQSISDVAVGQVRMFVGHPQNSGVTGWAPANGETLSASQFPSLANIVAGGLASAAATITLPSVPSPAPGVDYYVAETGYWPLHQL